MEKERIIVFIDGFNLYHALVKNFIPRYKWCDLRKLSTQFIDKETQEIKKIYFFSAYCAWNKSKRERHKNYVKVLLEHRGVYTVLGKFRKVKKNFVDSMDVLKCVPYVIKPFLKKLEYQTFEEKETDVNMALKILEHAFLDDYDHAFILSGDSDLAGAIRTVKRHFPDKKFTNLLPQKSKGKILQKVCGNHRQITAEHFKEALLPEKIELKNGNIIKMPEEYKDVKPSNSRELNNNL
jgi:uncharacterized LabA/DUF88 family protein